MATSPDSVITSGPGLGWYNRLVAHSFWTNQSCTSHYPIPNWVEKWLSKMAYFCPNGKGHGRVSQPCVTYGHAAWPCVP
ncbi:hypothetical protein F383_34042 [Gossypium arboreum]|uniref:Uncharacterized protein n=1 Tax=Gossypium arboreum TaxID=29729 RepID=A0A0B0N2C2_GOSAR|nr:hypothetical protein F383_34042 [Gossypium arboreum]